MSTNSNDCAQIPQPKHEDQFTARFIIEIDSHKSFCQSEEDILKSQMNSFKQLQIKNRLRQSCIQEPWPPDIPIFLKFARNHAASQLYARRSFQG